jgi:hypothetical protein
MSVSPAEAPIGYELPGITRTITQDRMTIYRNHLGLRVEELSAPVVDFHTDVEEARKLGFSRTVAEALHYYEFVSEIALNFFGEAWLTSARQSAVFLKPVFEGDVITAGATVKERTPEGSQTRVTLDAWCANQDGDKVLAATASALV